MTRASEGRRGRRRNPFSEVDGDQFEEGLRRIRAMETIATRAAAMANNSVPVNLDVDGEVSFCSPAMAYLFAPIGEAVTAKDRAEYSEQFKATWPASWPVEWFQPSAECHCCNLRMAVGLLLHEILRVERMAERQLADCEGEA